MSRWRLESETSTTQAQSQTASRPDPIYMQVCFEFRCIFFPTTYDRVTHFVRRTMLSKFRDENLLLLAHNFQTAVVVVVRSLLLNGYEFRSQMARVLQFCTLCIARGLHTNILLLGGNYLYHNQYFVREKRLSTLT